MKEMVGGCCVCSDERGWPDNPLVYCDGNGCTVAVHQACYGIVTVPTGPWYCRKCESPDTKGKVRCQLCPSKSGALKKTDTGGWAHVVCALYIPEVRFGNVTSMEPIVLRLIPTERYNKTCYICQESGKAHRSSAGACMQCNKSGCRQQFHVTCAQSLGLLCEEAGNYLDNVKYCGYCQHHYSKLKKGGNVKTIPPYKPVTHDSQSSDSSGERETEGGAATPTHQHKAKGPGRKSAPQGGGSVSGKSTPNASKTPTSTAQPMDTNQDVTETPSEKPQTSGGRKHKANEKSGKSHHSSDKKKPSPSRRGSSAGEGGSKNSTPAPSPQHITESGKLSGNIGIGVVKTPVLSPSSIKPEIATSAVGSAALSTSVVTTSVVQSASKITSYQESVITNVESVENKQTKKRKAISAANPQIANEAAALVQQQGAPFDGSSQSNTFDSSHPSGDVLMDSVDKAIKKAKTDSEIFPPGHFSSVSPAHPAPPSLPHTPADMPNPRHLTGAMPGPSGVNPPSNIRSPSQPQGGREGASLLVSVPLPASGHGLNLAHHAQVSMPSDTGPSPHIFHQPQKLAALEQTVSSHQAHNVSGRSTWGGLNVSYEMQEPSKGVSAIPGPSKDSNPIMLPLAPAAIRNKKRAALSAVSGSSAQSNIHTSTTQTLPITRRPPQVTPPPIYQETIKDSPPTSPGSDRPLKPKLESSACSGPHMLGNELNPTSGAAARLQEHLHAELAAHAAHSHPHSHALAQEALLPTGPPLINRASESGSRGRSGSSGAQSLDQLLERQWEQGSQFLMEQAQHFDIASLLSCLHQLRTENVRLEEHVGNLLQRRDHLLAVNARLAIPLTTVNTSLSEPARCRDASAPPRAPPPPPNVSRAPDSMADRSHQAELHDVISSIRRASEANQSARLCGDVTSQLMVREVQQKPS